MALMRILLFCVFVAYKFGGEIQAAEPTAGQAIVVVGDESSSTVLAELRRAGLAVNGDKSALGGAKLVVVAQYAADGMRPVHRELLKEMSRAGCRNILWIITDSQKVDDWELLELEQQEARDLLKASGLPGDAAKFAVDKNSGSTQKGTWLVGWKAISEFATK